jgi:hypothetical protein
MTCLPQYIGTSISCEFYYLFLEIDITQTGVCVLHIFTQHELL